MNIKLLWNKLYEKYGKNSGTMILHIGALSWILSSLAQISAIASNKQYSSKDKKYMIPQEMYDGITNILAFYLVTKSFKDVGQRLVSTGKWSNNAIRGFFEKNFPNFKLGDLSKNLKNEVAKNQPKLLEDFYKVYDPFRNGIDMATTTIGSVISCNLLTPVIRNSIAAKMQKKKLSDENRLNYVIFFTNRNINMNRYLDNIKNRTNYSNGTIAKI